MKKLYALLAAAALVTGAGSAHATNYLVNGGFETGDYTGWTSTGAAPYAVTTGFDGFLPHSGRFSRRRVGLAAITT